MTPAKVHRIEITLSDDKLASLDAARGLVPRAAFIKHWTEVGINTALALSSSETPEPATPANATPIYRTPRGLPPTSPRKVSARQQALNDAKAKGKR